MSEWIDGPGLAAWLEAEFPETVKAARYFNGRDQDSLGRALVRWEGGARVSVYSADFHLTARGLHISMIPDELYTTAPYRAGRKPLPEREQGFALLEAGYTPSEVAERVGCAVDTAKKWKRKLRAEGALA